ncbi:MAG: tetratricopeptide repeat protein, partial [Gammaproteobacteria bacterium]|nr:tetratricopeptide repeat protein [Gammaproteobacteria bacterium]
AVAWFDRALALESNNPKAHFGRGSALRELGRPKEAVAAIMRAIALKPDYSEACNLHGEILLKRGMIAEAMQSFEMALQADPSFSPSWFQLGNARLTRGDVLKARDCYLKAAQLGSGSGNTHYSYSNYLLSLNYLAMDPDEIFRAHCDWARHYAHEQENVAHSNSPDLTRRLRVGYVSGDFMDHPVATFIKSVLQQHDREAFEVFGFSNVARPDETTKLLREHIDRWHEILQLDDAAASDLIRSEEIDILVDIAGHTGGNRLGVFARRSAPVQITYLGYPNTTGLHAMGFRLTDPVADPPGFTDAWYTEQLVRLPQTFLCYAPPPKPPAVASAPCENNGFVTFGSVSNLAKISPETLDDWAAVLKQVAGSRMILKRRGFHDEATRQDMLRKFTDRGIRPERITLLTAGQSQEDHLGHYARLDAVLDTFPYNGTTTSCESLLMGVPIVTHYGQTHVSRVGLSLLASVGLEELAGGSHEEFVARAVSLAQAPDRMRAMRAALRDRFLSSPVCDARGFVRGLEEAYRQLWRSWCQNQGSGK